MNSIKILFLIKKIRSYYNIESGLTRECLHDLTKAPTKTIWNDSPELWPYILKGEKEDWAMTTGSTNSPDANNTASDNFFNFFVKINKELKEEKIRKQTLFNSCSIPICLVRIWRI